MWATQPLKSIEPLFTFFSHKGGQSVPETQSQGAPPYKSSFDCCREDYDANATQGTDVLTTTASGPLAL
jgi:hypothetical protein